MKKILKQLKEQVIILTAKWMMNIHIKKAALKHKKESVKYADSEKDSKHIKQYIVLLDRPLLKKDGNIHFEEQLFLVNRHNFKLMKHEQWLPRKMKIDELKRKAFYVSSINRNYQQEYQAKERAREKYIAYLKTKNNIAV